MKREKVCTEPCAHCGHKVTYSIDSVLRAGVTPLVGTIVPYTGCVGWSLLDANRFRAVVFCSSECVEEHAPLPPPLLLMHPSRGCSHEFVDSTTCLKCGAHCSDLRLEEEPSGEPGSIERAKQILRFIERFGEPTTEAGRQRVAALRQRVSS